MAKLSIIVPVYNTEKYLNKCLNSLINQTLEDIEIIVVNDGSTDNSEKIIQNFYKKYPSKIIPLKKENGGLSDARNYGISYAKGDYIGFVDSDDFVESSMYEEMYDLALKERSDLVECDFSWDFPKRSKIDFGAKYEKEEDYFINGRVMACNKIYRASLIKNNSILFPCGLFYEDVEFFYKLVPYINKTSYLSKVFYHYIQRESSIINSKSEKTSDVFNILNNIIKYYKETKKYDYYNSCLEYLYIRILLGSSFLRILKVKDKQIRNKLLKKTWEELNRTFPSWRKNIYLKENKNLKNFYYKTINVFSYKIYSVLFRLF